jgi:hypothetical protein
MHDRLSNDDRPSFALWNLKRLISISPGDPQENGENAASDEMPMITMPGKIPYMKHCPEKSNRAHGTPLLEKPPGTLARIR